MKRMEITGGPDGLRVAPLSTTKIRSAALWLRRELGIERQTQPDIVRLLEFDFLRRFDLTIDVKEDDAMPEDEAYALPSENTIVFSASTYDDLHAGRRRARFTAAHELGHLLLHAGVKLSRQGSLPPRKIYESSEWQANAFSGEFLAPPALILEHCRSTGDISRIFNVSPGCARARAKRLRKEGKIMWED